MRELYTFDDVLIVPKFSDIESRSDVDLSTQIGFYRLRLPIVSANMDTVTGVKMAIAMEKAGAEACLHRFCSIEENVKMFDECTYYDEVNELNGPMVSIGLGQIELDRAKALFNAGAYIFIIDVAHGSQKSVAQQAKELRKLLGQHPVLIVGNFASKDSVKDFLYAAAGATVDGIKVGVGPGSACTTRLKTGVGYPQLSAVKEIAECLRGSGIKVIADGGMKTPGDIAKALGAGAHVCMIGGMLAGTDETPGEVVSNDGQRVDQSLVKHFDINNYRKKYRGSASKESYEAQGKMGKQRTAEGESFMVPYKGPVADILQDIEGGLRSAFTYVGARNLQEFHELVEFVRISPATVKENGAHGK